MSLLERELDIVYGCIKDLIHSGVEIDMERTSDLSLRLENFWKSNYSSLISTLAKPDESIIEYCGAETGSICGKRRFARFVTTTSFYFDKILIRDPFLEGTRCPDPELRLELIDGAFRLLNSIRKANLDWVIVIPPIGVLSDKILSNAENFRR